MRDAVEPAKGYVGLTDPDWYRFLSVRPRVDEVNFWQPYGNRAFRALRQGEPFFFKLRSPFKAIAGFGFFERYEALPAWQAWDCFGEMNGAPDFDSMIHRIARLRGDGDRSLRSGQSLIGCIMITASIFLTHDEWVAPPADWARSGIQQGKTYALDSGEGDRVFRECIERAITGGRYWNVDTAEPTVLVHAGPRHGSPHEVRPRLGQGTFSLAVRDAYGGACAVTGEHSAPVLEAAHIVPYGRGGEHRVENGLLFRSDLHRLYDRGYVTVTPDYVFRVGDSLHEDFRNGRSYYHLNGAPIAVPERQFWRPDRGLLEWHGREVFRG